MGFFSRLIGKNKKDELLPEKQSPEKQTLEQQTPEEQIVEEQVADPQEVIQQVVEAQPFEPLPAEQQVTEQQATAQQTNEPQELAGAGEKSPAQQPAQQPVQQLVHLDAEQPSNLEPIAESAELDSPKFPDVIFAAEPEQAVESSTQEGENLDNPLDNSLENPLDSSLDNPDEFILKLRAAKPTPGAWLEVVLDGITEVNAKFWQRLDFLFVSLNTPAHKAQVFVEELRQWLESMNYSRVDEFASELQYRLALALGMENEAEEKQRFWAKLWQGLARTRELISGGLRELFASSGELDNAFWESLEEVLITSDVGYEASLGLVERIRTAAKKTGAKTRAEAKELLLAELELVLSFPPRIEAVNPPEVVLMVGVNGAGKTTTIAKLAYREHLAGRKVLVAAGDTFRAAAVEQLEVWAKRVGAGFYAKAPGKDGGADPAAVAYEAVGVALAENYDVVFIDTAGRLQTKVDLMEELSKISRVLAKRHPGAPHRCILVLDGTTGQNALSQTKLFSESSKVTEIIISKLDGTAKAGVAVGVAMQYKIPITFIGLGEKMEDLRPFDGAAFAKALLD